MYRAIIFLAMCAAAIAADVVKKSPVDLLREGRMIEAQQILEKTDAPERYHLLLDALREPNAIEACFLYREISARFPGTDCDVFAQERLLQAAEMGIDISALVLETAPAAEPGEWHDASATYEVERPLTADDKLTDVKTDGEPEAVEVPDETEVAEPTPAKEEMTVKEAAKLANTVAEEPEPVVRREPLVTQPEPDETVAAKEELVEAKPKQEPSKSTTLNYSEAVPTKKDTGIVAASLIADPPLPPKKPESKVKPINEQNAPHDIDKKSPDGWYIQVGAFGNHDNARKLSKKLEHDGYKTYLVPRDDLLQVRVGVFQTKEEGRSIGDQIKEKYSVPAVLVTVP
ncbi:MAG: SPOR domain-containing protein [Calditrichaeota bacterium]|nr:SPOR domain-containing protein [Calditrichota bacterium]MCB9367805.1 SPOR domain-containing protein [Calditrichota bacterium]